MASIQEKYYRENRGPDLRRTPCTERRVWTVNELWDRHHEILRLISIGMTNVAVAEKLGISAQSVSLVRNSPVAQEHLMILHGARDAETVDVARDIRDTAPEALKILKMVMRGDQTLGKVPVQLRARTAEGLLDRAGYGAPKKIETINAYLTSEEILAIKERAKQNSNIIDITPEAEDGETVYHTG